MHCIVVVKDDDELAVRLVFLTSMCMRHGRGAEASRVNRIHVTLTIDLCQTRSYLARLTTLSSSLAALEHQCLNFDNDKLKSDNIV